jgi:type IV pilus assembly protein PilF
MSGDYETCKETLEKAVDLEPEDAQGHYLLALAYQRSVNDNLDKAQDQFKEALRADPEFSQAYLALGRLYRNVPGNEALAIEQIKKALAAAQKADDVELATQAHAELARLYYARDQYDQCIDEWMQVLETRPDDSAAHRRLGLCYAMRRRTGDMEQAIEELETALKIDFDHIDAYYFYLGQYYAMQDEYPRAFLAWDQFLRFSDNEELNATVREWMAAYRAALEEEDGP